MELDFASLWKTIKNGSIKDQKRFWDLRAAEFNSQLASERTVEEAEDVLKYLKDREQLIEITPSWTSAAARENMPLLSLERQKT